ncbi:MAG TPA: ISNCY family transposase [Candidatus Acidoferrales bacterium]|jgi:IS5 family transposase|nr:ISNCY family transposase [Candidatus Acidoferrales bacterium]
MIQLRHQQPSLWGGFWAEEVAELWEPWMRAADQLLDDEALLDAIYEAQGKRRKHSRTLGRKQTPAEVVLRLLILKHARNWSFEVLEREVRANLIYRDFTRLGTEKVPDAKVLAKIAKVLGPEVVQELHQRIVELAQEAKLVWGRKMRVDTTVVETPIHYPTDSSLLGDGARVLTRLIKQVSQKVGGVAERVRDRMRSVKKKVVAIAVSSRRKGPEGDEQRKGLYRQLLSLTRKVRNQARRVCAEVSNLSRRKQVAAQPLTEKMQTMIERVGQVIRQTKARILMGNTKAPGKLASVFEAHTEIIRKGKASKPTEFGKLVKVQEAENQIITDYEIYDERPNDSDLLVEAVEKHEKCFGRTPVMVAADAGFYSSANEKKLEEKGVQRVSVPNRNTRSEARRQKQKQRWFKRGQRWRTGCEGRISVLKRRHGLNRSRYRGPEGIQLWVGLGIIADNLISMGNLMAMRGAKA